jgi:PE-PPE domain
VYPAGFDIDRSVAAGVPVLDQTIKSNSGQFLMVVGYSEGALVAEEVRRDLDPSDPGAPPVNSTNPDNPGLLWVMIASPNVPNGGLAARFPVGFGIPFVITSNGPAQPSPYDTQYVTNEYDPYADFPAYFNPLSLVNSLFAVVYVHPDQYYDSIDYDPLTGATNDPNVLVHPPVTNSAGGTDTYVFVLANELPLFAPVRQIAGILQLTPLTEPLLDSVEPLVRLLVDMGYTDRQNLNPQQHVQFSLITPPERILETIAGVPGAIGQGVTNLVNGLPAPVAPTNSPAINAKSLAEEPSEPQVNDEPTIAAATDPAPPQTPSSSGTSATETPVATTLSDPGPTLGKVTEDGNKATPNTSSPTTQPKKNVFTELADTVKGFFSPKPKPAPSTPSSEPTGSTPSGSTTQDQSEGPTSNAA